MTICGTFHTVGSCKSFGCHSTRAKPLTCGVEPSYLGEASETLTHKVELLFIESYSLPLASVFNNYYFTTIADIRKEFPDLEVHAAQLSIADFDISFDISSSRLSSFTPTTVSIMNQTTCSLDPFNTKIVMQHSEQFINVFVHIFNLCFSSGIFPASFKAAVVKNRTCMVALNVFKLTELGLNLQI